MSIPNPKQNNFAAPTMAATPTQSRGSTYAPAATDSETLRKRLELASRLFQAKKSGMSMGEAVSSETGVDIGNIQQGSVDVAGGTGLTESEIVGFAERLYNNKYGAPNAPKGGSMFDQQEQAARTKATASGAFGGDNWRGKSSETAISTPLLDRYDALQAAPFGSSSNQRRSLESESGKAMRMARSLSRKGYNEAAEKMALAGAQAKMGEPSIRTQAYREQQEQLGKRTEEDEKRALTTSQKAVELQKKWMEKMEKELNDPNTRVLNSQMASSFFNKNNG